MNQFNKKLATAKQKQQRIYLLLTASILATLLMVAAIFLVSRGTRIEILPEAAKEQGVVTISQGIGSAVGNTVYSLTSAPEVTVSSPGFKTGIKRIDRKHLGSTLSVELFELPGRLVAAIDQQKVPLAKGTLWQINEQQVAIGEQINLELEPGEYTLRIDNPFCRFKTVPIKIVRDWDTLISPGLQPVTGTITIESSPSGARITVNDTVKDTTPLELDLSGGEYQIRVEKEKYIQINDTVLLTREKKNPHRNYKLQLQQASVTVTLNPPGGNLLIDGITINSFPVLVDATVQHTVHYMKPGYYQQKQSILLEPGEKKNLVFDLKQEFGKIVLTSTPAADIRIGKKNYGSTPLTLQLPAVQHKVEFRKKGYITTSKTIRPKSGSTQKVHVRLLTKEQERRKKAPREYTNQAGIKLKLFFPKGTFVKGAPRSEKGQRANEFQQTVQLSRPFYAGVYEVTNQQFTRFQPQKAAAQGNLPVTNISWQEAARFCNWLSKEEQLDPFYSFHNNRVTGFNLDSDGYRLLSEAEWEWLARKAGKKKQAIFTWGESETVPPGTANIADESSKGTVRFYVSGYTDGYSGLAPVGSFEKEDCGLYDLGGNVSEWTHDVYSIIPPRSNEVVANPFGTQQGSAHVYKGPHFRSGTRTTLRPSFREGGTGGQETLGLRIGRFLY